MKTRCLLMVLLFSSSVWAQSLPERYDSLSETDKQVLEQRLELLQPRLQPIQNLIIQIQEQTNWSPESRFAKLNQLQSQLEQWRGDSLTKFVLLKDVMESLKLARQTAGEQVPLRIPYQDHQIKTQFNVSGAQYYALGEGNVTLVRGEFARGTAVVGDRVIFYFKAGGPVITRLREDVSDGSGLTKVFLLDDDIPPQRFVGGSAFLIPQR